MSKMDEIRALREARLKSSRGGVESKTAKVDLRPLEHASEKVARGGRVATTGKDALAGIAQAIKSAQPTASNRRIPEKPETAYSTDRQIAGVASGSREAIKPKKGRPLDSQKDKTLAAMKPWLAEGMSRRTWYRRQAEQRAKL